MVAGARGSSEITLEGSRNFFLLFLQSQQSHVIMSLKASVTLLDSSSFSVFLISVCGRPQRRETARLLRRCQRLPHFPSLSVP